MACTGTTVNVAYRCRQRDMAFIENERYTHSQLSVWIHFDRQKKRR